MEDPIREKGKKIEEEVKVLLEKLVAKAESGDKEAKESLVHLYEEGFFIDEELVAKWKKELAE